MDRRESHTWKAMVFCVLIQATAPVLSGRLIFNYDNNPNLQKAMEYDLTMDNMIFLKPDGTIDRELYHSYVARASRELAEKYYLAYLKEVKEPFQRARVYIKLSDLYSGSVRHEVAPHPTAEDIERALEYCRKALAEAPDAVSLATIHIRGKATMLPDRKESFRAQQDYYQWLLSLDEQKITDHWLPLQPGDSRPDKAAVEGLLKFIDKYSSDVVAYNLVDMAVNMGRTKMPRPSPTKQPQEYDPSYLLEIVERFPGTRAQERAKQELNELVRIVADEHVARIFGVEEDEMAVPEGEALNQPSPAGNKAENEMPTAIAGITDSDGRRRSSLAPLVLGSGILTLALAVFVGAKGLQWMKKPRSP